MSRSNRSLTWKTKIIDWIYVHTPFYPLWAPLSQQGVSQKHGLGKLGGQGSVRKNNYPGDLVHFMFFW